MKKLASKVAHNGPKTLFFSIANRPISHILFHKNGSLRDFYIMTLPDGYWLLNIRYLTWIWDSDMFVCFFRASTNFEGHPNWVFRLLTFSSLALSLKEITKKVLTKSLENSKLALVCCSDELSGWVSSNRLNSESCTATSPYHPLELTGNFLVTVVII